ncbi:MAG: ABC transporter ATP-binding protein [Chloroflexi bacterium]|nr:ABC transporter ATP-binding protein [Chloroflexota bacterium]
MQPVLEVQNLKVYYHTPRGPVKAVDGVDFELQPNERFGLVGESGSGKTTIALALMRMVRRPGRIEGGQALLQGVDLVALSEDKMRALRLAAIAMVAQGAMNSLNPVMRVRHQLADGMRDHGLRLSKSELSARVADLLRQVGLTPEVGNMYAHELSGGMKQRVCIAIAISLQPRVLIADEPTSALDVVVQKQVMDTLGRVQEQLGAAVILVGHDMGLMAQFVHRLGVMYAGKMVEVSPVTEIFREPLHPYTRLLIESLPSVEQKSTLRGIPGLPPSLLNRVPGCPFQPRCPYAMDVCSTADPPFREVRPNRHVACYLYEDVSGRPGEAARVEISV